MIFGASLKLQLSEPPEWNFSQHGYNLARTSVRIPVWMSMWMLSISKPILLTRLDKIVSDCVGGDLTPNFLFVPVKCGFPYRLQVMHVQKVYLRTTWWRLIHYRLFSCSVFSLPPFQLIRFPRLPSLWCGREKWGLNFGRAKRGFRPGRSFCDDKIRRFWRNSKFLLWLS